MRCGLRFKIAAFVDVAYLERLLEMKSLSLPPLIAQISVSENSHRRAKFSTHGKFTLEKTLFWGCCRSRPLVTHSSRALYFLNFCQLPSLYQSSISTSIDFQGTRLTGFGLLAGGYIKGASRTFSQLEAYSKQRSYHCMQSCCYMACRSSKHAQYVGCWYHRDRKLLVLGQRCGLGLNQRFLARSLEQEWSVSRLSMTVCNAGISRPTILVSHCHEIRGVPETSWQLWFHLWIEVALHQEVMLSCHPWALLPSVCVNVHKQWPAATHTICRAKGVLLRCEKMRNNST